MMVKYWSAGPKWEPIEDGVLVLSFGRIPFPDLQSLSPEERELLRPALAAHPEYLLGAIWFDRMIQ
jgi:hypothetical protein